MWTAAFPQVDVIIETQEWGVYLDSLDADSPPEGKPDICLAVTTRRLRI